MQKLCNFQYGFYTVFLSNSTTFLSFRRPISRPFLCLSDEFVRLSVWSEPVTVRFLPPWSQSPVVLLWLYLLTLVVIFQGQRLNFHSFYKTWNSKFNNRSSFHQMDGCVDEKRMTLKFAEHFVNICWNNNSTRNNCFLAEFIDLRSAYIGYPLIQYMLLRLS